MRKRLSQIWQNIRQSFSVEESVNTAIEGSQAILEAAKTLQEQGASLAVLKPVLQNSSSFLDVLCSPMAQVIGAGLPFVPMGIALLKLTRDVTKQNLTLEDCVLIVSQAAYLESAKEILRQYPDIDWDAKLDAQAVEKQLKKLKDVELDYESASQVINCFHQSPLAEAFNQVLLARLTAVPSSSSQLLVQRIANNTHRYILKAWVEAGDVVRNIMQPSFEDWQREQKRFHDIDDYLKNHIAKKPLDTVFDESFSFQDIYVPLKAKPVEKNGNVDEKADSFSLEVWARTNLLNLDNLDKVMFIQGGPGRGKSVFCRMFANLVRQHFYPVWIPILIRLRDIDNFAVRLENTLEAELKLGFIQDHKNWLTNPNTRFLFILDGFDELHIEARNNLNLEAFIKQVAGFQKECKDYREMGHRVIITGRAMALQGIPYLPPNLERVEIVAMNEQLQAQWFEKWEAVQVNQGESAAFQQFLHSNKCPDEVKQLAQEPLLLYLLAAMYRDGKLDIDKLEQASDDRTAKIIVYQEALIWVLTKQRAERDGTNINLELTQQKPEDLKRILIEAAVCVVQSGGAFAAMSMLEARLQADETAKAFLDKAKQKLGDDALKTALAAFYIRPTEKQAGGAEFFHKSFSEFLFAERLKARLKTWTQYYDAEEGRQPIVLESSMNWEIYDLLGYGGLTPEIVDYLMGLLIENQNFPWVELFKRLDKFYSKWCEGKFIDSAAETLPQKKLRQLQNEKITGLGQRQVDVYAGLNVMILLLELHRYAQAKDDLKTQIIFYPSGQPQADTLTVRLLRIINYSDGLKLWNFINVVGQFLSGANLSGAFLSGANLIGADLRDADLSGANLNGADLSGAHLIRANLNGADLGGANLISTDLSDADLSGADLNGADLSRANLSGANLISANLNDADLSDADLSGANLSGANLSGANLSGANLSGANLISANLSDANLSGTDLSYADLSYADLSGTDLSGTDLSYADLSYADLSDQRWGDIRWDENTKWEGVRGLDMAVNVPAKLKQQLGIG
ncbi:pentapeptide repeat-containing protein [Halotia branconii]|uniref:Pentapeptide repeat-containing protein n=1 Tax=Halotia branconii CENA392 TaxID=1539056 RepID=A0AAJ6P807_9CYAN|nr:pentapeptide repeat-containing protein [Halotia branconii]WGV24195.1 pentapeptide repeat-containing protein [Halotia branconii CENA392]